MGRIRALGYGLAVAVVVFAALSLPLLRAVYGPAFVLAAYAGVSLVAGGVAYLFVRWVADRLVDRPADPDTVDVARSGDAPEGDRTEEGTDDVDPLTDPEIEREIQTLREDN